MRELTGFRGKTFSPAQSWIDGGPAFAFKKLEAVRALLVIEAQREEGKKRRQIDWQRIYDLQDAATTISDAIHYIDPDGELRKTPEFWQARRAEQLEGLMAEARTVVGD